MISLVLGVALTVLFVIKWLKDNIKYGKLPPGPWGFPIFGHFPILGLEPHKTILKWSKIYGPIVNIRFGGTRTIVVNDAKLVKQCFAMADAGGRHVLSAFARGSGKVGILFTSGRHNTEQRQFAIKNLRDQGMGKKSMESIIQEDLGEFLQKIKVNEGTPMSNSQLFSPHIINSLWSIVMSTKLNPNKSAYFSALIQHRLAKIGSKISQLAFFMPWLETAIKILTFGSVRVCKDRVDAMKELYNHIAEQLEEHKTTWVKNQPRDFSDAYFDKIDETTDPASSFHETHGAISKHIGDIFMGGIETTSTTLDWSLYFLAKNQQIQKKLQMEMDTVIGTIRSPTLSDKGVTPYAEAVMYEVMRMSSITPLSMPHKALNDFTFQGYRIPKDTMLLPNFYGCHHDPDVWGDPEVFRPERWLSAEGSKLKKDNFFFFSTGKRVCPGESLARDQLWLYITSLFKRFNVTFDGPAPPLVTTPGLIVSSKAFKVVFKSRTQL